MQLVALDAALAESPRRGCCWNPAVLSAREVIPSIRGKEVRYQRRHGGVPGAGQDRRTNPATYSAVAAGTCDGMTTNAAQAHYQIMHLSDCWLGGVGRVQVCR